MAQLILADGTRIEGKSFGAEVACEGEVVFNTGMMGYPESLTDPSYTGQIIVLTFPLVGNYGVPGDEFDQFDIRKTFESSKIHIRGLIVSEYSDTYSHWNAKMSLGEWMKKNNIPGITGVDTRALTQKLREHGVMLGQIVQDGKKPAKKITDPNVNNLVASVSLDAPKLYKCAKKNEPTNVGFAKSVKGGATKTIVAFDTGMKNNILRSLLERGVNVIRVPWNYDIWNGEFKFDGIFISNGPGDTSTLHELHEIIRVAFKKKMPIFGICLGIQVMSIAAGAKTYKLKYGHRAQNQPVMDVKTKKCYLTSQNHGFAVDEKTLPKEWEVSMVNVNDGTVEGIRHKNLPYFAVQFHPEAMPGPVDTNFLFDDFVKLVNDAK